MFLRVATFATMVLCSMSAALAGDRLAVLEFFGRPNGAYCSAAGPAMISLQNEFAGRAVLLEYDYDRFRQGRIDRFRATGVNAPYLPLVMVGSGYRVSSGPVSYKQEYQRMIDDEIARAPRATVTAFWRRTGVTIRAYVRLDNTGHNTLREGEDSAVWLILYENTSVGVSGTWVRSAIRRPLEHDLVPGEHTTAVIDASVLEAVEWHNMKTLILVENRPGGTGRYDMLQALEAIPANILATPAEVSIHPSKPTAELRLDGPHVLQWTATTDVPWLEVSPTSGTLPTTATVVLRNDLRPPTPASATVSIDAVGDSMAFQLQVPITVGSPVRRATGRAGVDSLPLSPASRLAEPACPRR